MRKKYYMEKNNIDEITVDHRANIILKLINDYGLKILDVGCGSGEFSRLAKKRGNYVCGIDISKKNIDSAKNKIDEVILQDTEDKWEIDNQSYDLVIFNAYLEHIFDYNFQLREARRVLKDNGEIIIMSPNSGSLVDRFALFFGRTPRCFKNYEHIRQFTLPMMIKIIMNNGFEILTKIGAMKIGQKKLFSFINVVCPTWGYCFIVKARKKQFS